MLKNFLMAMITFFIKFIFRVTNYLHLWTAKKEIDLMKGL